MPDPSRPIESVDQLVDGFLASEKPPSAFGVGMETEKFGVDRARGAPIHYARSASEAGDGARISMSELLEELAQAGSFTLEREHEGGPVVALRKGQTAITLEPGSQLELSGRVHSDVFGARRELLDHLSELASVSAKYGLVWLSVGFHPLASQADLDWVPKQRYLIMREYLPPLGSGAHDMMRRTATTQSNFDYADERDAMTKLRTLLAIAPLVHAMTANAPFREGRPAGLKSVRGDVWLHMDPTRSGLIPALFDDPQAGYADYVEWALDAGMFLFKRDGEIVRNTGQTFRDFLAHGFQGHRATAADWALHLNTLFPEARLKNTLEFRACDALPVDLAVASVALTTGILYDEAALAETAKLVEGFRYEEVEALRPRLVQEGLSGSISGQPVRVLAERLLSIAEAGLERRARRDETGANESTLLAPLAGLVAGGKVPADLLLRDPPPDDAWRSLLIERTRVI